MASKVPGSLRATTTWWETSLRGLEEACKVKRNTTPFSYLTIATLIGCHGKPFKVHDGKGKEDERLRLCSSFFISFVGKGL